jgi:hypothetical protein
MMRQAFDGLRTNTERSLSSSTEQRGELERPGVGVDRSGDAPNAFIEETYSYASVSESDGVNATPFAMYQGISRIESTEFFNYLTAIGGA